MGWTREKYHGVQIEVGDDPLGVVLHMVEEFSRYYRSEVGRRPQLLEFVHALEHALIHDKTRWHFDDLQTKEVVDIKVTTKSAPRLQKLQTGDYFAIPLPDGGGYAYGRVLFTENNHDQLLELYRLKTADLKSLAELERKSLRPLTWKYAATTKAITSRGWTVLGNRPIPREFEFPPFFLGARETAFQIRRGDRITTATESEAKQLEPIITYLPEDIEQRLVSHGGRSWPEVRTAKRYTFQVRTRSARKNRPARPPKKSRAKSPPKRAQ